MCSLFWSECICVWLNWVLNCVLDFYLIWWSTRVTPLYLIIMILCGWLSVQSPPPSPKQQRNTLLVWKYKPRKQSVHNAISQLKLDLSPKKNQPKNSRWKSVSLACDRSSLLCVASCVTERRHSCVLLLTSQSVLIHSFCRHWACVRYNYANQCTTINWMVLDIKPPVNRKGSNEGETQVTKSPVKSLQLGDRVWRVKYGAMKITALVS